MQFTVALTGLYDVRLPQWGRAFWQDPNDSSLFLAFASGTDQLAYITSADSGVTWTSPIEIGPLDDFETHNNFDVVMDPRGDVHCAFRYNDSGCYSLLAKSGSSWSTATSPVGFVLAGDSGSIGGFQGSILVMEGAGGLFGDISTFPAVRIAAKDSNNDVDSYYVSSPYTGAFTKETIGGSNAGTNGGFPISYCDASFDAYSVAYLCDTGNYIVVREKTFGSWADVTNTPVSLSGVQRGFTTNLAIGSGSIKNFSGLAISCSPSGHDLWGGWNEQFGVGVTYGRLQNIAVTTSATGDIGEGDFPFLDAIPTSGIFGVGDNFPGSGTNCDFTFDDTGDLILYFQSKDTSGRQALARIRTRPMNDGQYTKLFVTEVNNYPSGILYTATASHTSTGGWGNKCFYNGFKACRHPTSPGQGSYKGEFVVTQGYVSTYPSGSQLTVWNMKEAPNVQSPLFLPYYQIDYTATSGSSSEIFKDVISQSVTVNIANMFDADAANTYGLIGDGAHITLELDKARVVDRIEVVGQRSSSSDLSDIGRIDVYASFDDSEYSLVGSIPSGTSVAGERLRSLTTDQLKVDLSTTNFIQLFDAISAKYIRFNFDTEYANQGRRIGEIRLFGPATTVHQINTTDTTYTEAEQIKIPYTERFRRRQGELPSMWRSYGDFTWCVVASGEFVKDSILPTATTPVGYDGLVESGIFKILGASRGNGDGFSLRSEPIADASGLVNPIGSIPEGGIGPGHSGVVEVDLNIPVAEGSRQISYDLRYDMHPDDSFAFYTVNVDTGAETLQHAATGSFADWINRSVTLDDGDYKLRWVYTRGSDFSYHTFGTVWIDNVSGLDGAPISSIYGYLNADPHYETGIIYGYLEGKGHSQIHGFLSADPFDGRIYGYLNSQVSPDATSNIHGYLFGHLESSIHGYLLGGEDVRSYPTGAIYGFVKVPQSGADSTIYGFVEGDWGQTIYGYVRGYDSYASMAEATGNAYIHGYVYSIDGFSSIHGIVNGSGNNVGTSSIHSYIDGRYGIGDQVIHGYLLAPSGGSSSIDGYLIGWDGSPDFFTGPQSMIYGYLPTDGSETGVIHGYVLANFPVSSIYGYLGNNALTPSGGGTVAGGPGDNQSTSGVVGGQNYIFGYLKSHDGFQMIHGFVQAPPGGTSSIHGYVLSGATDDRIYGYLTAYDIAGTGIHGYASGVGYEESQIYGYAFGSSGDINSSIHGHLVGVLIPDSIIYGTLIGTNTSENSKAACPSHNFPLPSVPTVTIPTSCMN